MRGYEGPCRRGADTTQPDALPLSPPPPSPRALLRVACLQGWMEEGLLSAAQFEVEKGEVLRKLKRHLVA